MENNQFLTKHPPGSLKELWAVSLPMIVAMMSGNLMMFFDRLFLAQYATAAMNAVGVAGMIVAVVQLSTLGITSIAEVFVGKYNGSNNYSLIATPSWQMLWLSLALPIVFIPAGLYLGPYLLPSYHYADYAEPYFLWMMVFSCLVPAIGALAAFFVGIGNTRLIMVTTLIGNLLNLVLDPLFIFGLFEITPPMGTKGAAIATGISLGVQFFLLFWVFLSKKYREQYHTTDYSFKPALFMHCLKIGLPSSIGHFLEWLAWILATYLMAAISEYHLTVATVAQTLYFLMSFGFDGLQKGVTTLAANFIGSNQEYHIKNTWFSGIKLLIIFALPFGVLLIGYPNFLISLFLSKDLDAQDVEYLKWILRIACFGQWGYFLVDGLTWVSIGVLMAKEDTWYVMKVCAASAWFMGFLPIYLFMYVLQAPLMLYLFLLLFYGITNAVLFSMRTRNILSINKSAGLEELDIDPEE